jgi:hypothetical protein
MTSAFRLFALVLVVVFLLSSNLTAAEKKVYLGGVWYNQAPNGSLTICNECNAGRSVVSAPAVTSDTPTCYPCQKMVVQYSPAKSGTCKSCPSQSDGRLQLGAGLGCSSGGVRGLFASRPIRSLFSRLFGGCGG